MEMHTCKKCTFPLVLMLCSNLNVTLPIPGTVVCLPCRREFPDCSYTAPCTHKPVLLLCLKIGCV